MDTPIGTVQIGYNYRVQVAGSQHLLNYAISLCHLWQTQRYDVKMFEFERQRDSGYVVTQSAVSSIIRLFAGIR